MTTNRHIVKEAIARAHKLEMVDEFFRDHGRDLVSMKEAFSIADLKKKVTDLLHDIEDMSIINDILSRLYKNSFVTEIDEIFKMKDFNDSVKQEFIDFFMSTTGSLEEKFEFLKLLKTEGIIPEAKVTGATTKTKITSVMTHSSKFIERMTNRIMKWTPKISKAAVGEGEALMVFFVKGGMKGKSGDVYINGTEYEVKSTKDKSGSGGARFVSQDKAWGLSTTHYEKFIKELLKINPNADSSDRNTYNLNDGGLKNLSLVLEKIDDKKIIKLFELIISGVYLNNPDLKWIQSCVKNGLDAEKFKSEFAIFQFDYYLKITGFNNMIMMNTDAGVFLTLGSTADFRKALEGGLIRVQPSFSWKEKQNNSYQMGLKG